MADWAPPEVRPADEWVPPEFKKAWTPPELAKSATPEAKRSVVDYLTSADFGKTALVGAAQLLDMVNPGPLLAHGLGYLANRAILRSTTNLPPHEVAVKSQALADVSAELVGSGIFEKLAKTATGNDVGPLDAFNQGVSSLIKSIGRDYQSRTNGAVQAEDVEEMANVLMLGAMSRAGKVKRVKSETAEPADTTLEVAKAKKVKEPADTAIDQWAAKAIEAKEPQAFPALKKAGFVDQYGKPLAVGAGVTAALAAEGDDEASKAAILGVIAGGKTIRGDLAKRLAGELSEVKTAMKSVNLHPPGVMKNLYIALGDAAQMLDPAGDLARLDQVRMDLAEKGYRPEVLKKVDQVARTVEEIHEQRRLAAETPARPLAVPKEAVPQVAVPKEELPDFLTPNKRWALGTAAGGAAVAASLTSGDTQKAAAPLGLVALLGMSPKTPLRDIHSRLPYTTKVLTDLAETMGDRSEFTREHVLQRANKPGVSKFEKEMYADIMKDKPAIYATDLAAEVKKRTGDFELKAKEVNDYADHGLSQIGRQDGWLPEGSDAIPPPSRTTVYQSPAELGDANHFSDPNYFAHTRSFDEGGVRHVVEVQSDAAQKARKQLKPEERVELEKNLESVTRQRQLADNLEYQVSRAGKYTPFGEALDHWAKVKPQIEALNPDAGILFDSALYDRFLQASDPKLTQVADAWRNKWRQERPLADPSWDVSVGFSDWLRQHPLQHPKGFNGGALLQRIWADAAERLRVLQAEHTAKLATSQLDPVRPILKDWWKRIIREEIGEAGKARPNPAWENAKIALERAEWSANNSRERYGNMYPDRVKQDAEFVRQEKAILDATSKEIPPSDKVRFASADTVAKVEGWPEKRAALEERLARAKEDGDTAGIRENEERLARTSRFSPEHQPIYDRYHKDIETFLTRDLKGRSYTDAQGHTWIEVDLPARGQTVGPRQMFGKTDPRFAALLAGGSIAALIGANLSDHHPLEAAIAAGSALAAATQFPRYLRYIAKDWKGAAADTTGVGIAAGIVGIGMSDRKAGENFNTLAAAIVGLALAGKKMLPKNLVPRVGSISFDELANIRSGNLAVRERQYKNLRRAIEVTIPSKARREVVWAEAQKPAPQGLSSKEMKVVQAWRGFSQEMWKELGDVGMQTDFVENYVTRAAENAGGSPKQVLDILAAIFEPQANGGFVVSSRFLKKRTGVSIEGLERFLAEKGLRLNKDLAEVAEIYGRSVARAIENKRFVTALKAGSPAGAPYIVQSRKAPMNYVPVRAAFLQGQLIHPDIAPYLKTLVEARSSNAAVNAALALSMAQKRLAVSFSLFHAYNLAIAHLGARGLLGATSDLAREVVGKLGGPKGPISAAIEMYRRGGLGDQIDWGLREGLKIDPMAEAGVGAIEHLGNLADATIARATGIKPPIGKAAAALEGLQKKHFDRFTWDYLHFGVKGMLFIREFERALVREGFPDWSKAPDKVKSNVARQVASFVNDTYGHLNWERVAQEATSRLGRKFANFMLSPDGRVMSQLLLFAPDWTLSTFRAIYKALPGKTDTPITKHLHAAYTLRTAFFISVLIDAVNVQTSGHHIWDSEQKDPLRIEFKDGTSMQAFKHATEFGEWVREPMKTLRNKMAFLPSETIAQVAGQEYAGSKIPMEGSRMSHALKRAAPFPLGPFLDPALSPEEAAKKSALGSLGIQTYGHTPEQNLRRRELKRRDKEAEAFRKLLKE